MPGKEPAAHKIYYRIREVSEITGLAAYVLRFWESEFSALCPKRTESGQRLYRKADIDTILEIKHLLYDKKFTIEGARKHLKTPASGSGKNNCLIDEIAKELKFIRQMLDD